MLVLKTKNKELVDLVNGLFNVQNLKGVKFGLVVSKNIRILQQELKDLEEASKASPEFVELSSRAHALGEDPVALESLEKENEALVKERAEQMKELAEMMEEDAEIHLHSISENLLPEDITAAQITNIDKLIN